jgi:hypothetical protein
MLTSSCKITPCQLFANAHSTYPQFLSNSQVRLREPHPRGCAWPWWQRTHLMRYIRTIKTKNRIQLFQQTSSAQFRSYVRTSGSILAAECWDNPNRNKVGIRSPVRTFELSFSITWLNAGFQTQSLSKPGALSPSSSGHWVSFGFKTAHLSQNLSQIMFLVFICLNAYLLKNK